MKLFMRLVACVAALLGMFVPAQADDKNDIRYVPGSSRKVCQLTGDFDRELNKPTVNQTMKRFGLATSDFGYSFEHDGKLYFLFGNTYPTLTFRGKPNGQNDPLRTPDAMDAVAFTSDTSGENCVKLDFVRDRIGAYKNPVVLNADGQPAVTLRAGEPPVSGISQGGKMYVMFATDKSSNSNAGLPPGLIVERGPTRTVMAVSDDNARTFRYLYDFSKGTNGKSIYTAIAEWPDGYLYFWGAQGGILYRKSPAFFARMRAENIGKPDATRFLEYFAGVGPGPKPRFTKTEKEAAPLFQDYMEGSSEPHNCIADLSVQWNRFVRRWVMLYSCGNTSHGNTPGIWMRLAEQPWGPWSEPQTIFNAKKDAGLCHFIHRAVTPQNPTKCDDLSVPERMGEEGGHYAPYLISRFTIGDEAPATSTFYFTMSTFNPFTQVIMKTTIRGSR